ncbi:protein phosphatase 2C domain-containing protein [Streptomyces fradiae]|uniref:protein phosphatase 2C domain-containing protein n=2 Tax=Streptomyces fradiae TaxID=1906 RepID=UPI003987E416
MSKTHQLSACPGCSEPLEPGDRFCGACGYDLSAVPEPPTDQPTVALTVPPPPPPPPAPPAPPAVRAPQEPPAPQAPQTAPESPAPSAHPVPPAPPAPQVPPAPPVPQEPPAPQVRETPLPSQTPPAPQGAPAPQARPAPPASQGPPPPAQPPAPATAPAPAPTPTPAQPPALPSATATAPSPHPAPGPTSDPTPAPAATNTPAPTPRPARHGDPQGDYELAAPDPRLATPPAGAAGAPRCVACQGGPVGADGRCRDCGHQQPRERDHMESEVAAAVAAVSDRGLRHHRNEDAYAVSTAPLPDGSTAVVAVVCDGVSSATRPDDASSAAARAADASLRAALPRGTDPRQAMHDAIVAASGAVDALADETPGGASGPDGQDDRDDRDDRDGHDGHRHRNAPACTVVGAVVARDLLVVGWVGDSRAYWVPDDRSAPAARLTEDDSWAAQMVAAGLMDEAQAYADERAHAITGWLGADAYEVEPHTAVFRPDRPGVVVVCTDGLWNYAEAAGDMARVLPADAAERPLHGARVLVGHALDGGGHDNVTVAVVPFAGPRTG